MPLHSILIAACNRFDSLRKTIYSCLGSRDVDFELIINDDASSLNNADVFYDQISRLDNRIKIIRNQNNEGVGTRFFELHEIANGKYIHVLGSDDLLHPLRLSSVVNDLTNIRDNRTIWCSAAQILDANYKNLGPSENEQKLEIHGPYTVDYLKDSPWIHMPFEKYEEISIEELKNTKK